MLRPKLTIRPPSGTTNLVEVTNLTELIDVTLTAVADNDLLQYDDATSKWVNQAIEMPLATYDGAAIAEQLVGLTASQTLTNKTLTSPVINTGVSGTAAITIYKDADTSTVDTAETTASTTYTDLATAGPAVTVTTGTKALVILYAHLNNTTATANSYMGFAVSGATTTAPADGYAIKYRAVSAEGSSTASVVSVTFLVTLTAGSNTFTSKYRVNVGTGGFIYRKIIVIPI